MNPQIEQSINRISAGARNSVRAVVDGARSRSQYAAKTVANTKKPLNTLSGLGLKLSAVSHRTTDRVLKQQTRLTAHQLDAVAARFESAAGANGLRDLVKKQVRMVPTQVKRLGRDARESLSIIVEGGSEAGEVLKGSFKTLRNQDVTPRTKATRKKRTPAKKARKTAAARPAAKKTARKTTKKRAKKVAAKKVRRS
ncbi:MAG: hypothetical protein KJO19_13410 [Woeseia sp.]|nr:hypothetical protein [Woeseia sp.]MBT8098031.1 hypothetical protein [Woeseia sp.]